MTVYPSLSLYCFITTITPFGSPIIVYHFLNTPLWVFSISVIPRDSLFIYFIYDDTTSSCSQLLPPKPTESKLYISIYLFPYLPIVHCTVLFRLIRQSRVRGPLAAAEFGQCPMSQACRQAVTN